MRRFSMILLLVLILPIAGCGAFQNFLNNGGLGNLGSMGLEMFLPSAINQTFQTSEDKHRTYLGWVAFGESVDQVLLPTLRGENVTVESLATWVGLLNDPSKVKLTDSEILVVQELLNGILRLMPEEELANFMNKSPATAALKMNLIRAFEPVGRIVANSLLMYTQYREAPAGASGPSVAITHEVSVQFLITTNRR